MMDVYDLGQLHHVGIVVDEIQGAARMMRSLYGIDITVFDESEYTCFIDGVEHRTVQRLGLSDGPPHVELLRAVPGSAVWRAVGGIHHLGFVVDDLEAASTTLEERGAKLWMAGTRNGRQPVGCVYHRDPLGQVIELLDRGAAQQLSARRAAHGHIPSR
ncbi:VOC family protein [Nocardia elegans]|uniref:VOC family protein n=1 Tax=Nocardia elegans TaxID=300029 RepID=UPI0018949E4A|nr:VOC family protein [Nocardia elegans]MBF6451130.1 VOC family protein [Nocardia elegans]